MEEQNQTKMEVKDTEAAARADMDGIRAEAAKKRMAYLEDLEPGLSQKAATWKDEYKHVETIHILSQLWIYRGLSRGEYLALMAKGGDKNTNEIDIVNTCLLWPEIDKMDWDAYPAGLPTTLSDLILAASGFGTEDPVPIKL